MRLGDYDYHLPKSRIARRPPPRRTASRVLIVRGDDAHAFDEIRFEQIGKLLQRGDVLVGNDTKVLPARLFARKPSGGAVEIMLERMLGESAALVQLRAGKPIRAGQILRVGQAEPITELIVRESRGRFFIVECAAPLTFAAVLRAHGQTPLPPYIARAACEQDAERYQTVYAAAEGAVAAPTAGLHFDRALLARLTEIGVDWTTITLHIGAGTFSPVREDNIARHAMHREWMQVGEDACAKINRAKQNGRRVIAVGTTVVRALETAAQGGRLAPFCGDTELFILPGYKFRAVDALITNFHLPRSTLLMMVCAFAGREKIMRAYQHAVSRDFRFYSYGDAMFMERV